MALMPILLWAYIFSYINNSWLNAKRFIIWIIAWSISVLPVLYIEDILKALWIEKFNILSQITFTSFMPLQVGVSLWLTILIIWIFSFFAWFIFLDKIWIFYKTFLKNLIILNIFILIFLIPYYFIVDIWILSSKIKDPILWLYWTTWLVFLYYIIVWLLEESSKHFNFIPSSLFEIDNIYKWLVFATFIALWFWFIENILYLNSIFQNYWFWSAMISTWIFRWIFSLFVHIFCSLIVAAWFLRMYFSKNSISFFDLRYIKSIITAFTASIWVHAIYDISLTLWFTLIIFIYFIVWYLYITKIFYKVV